MTTDDGSARPGNDRRKFLTGAGVAAGAVAGGALLGSTPASATPPSTGEHDLDLVYLDMSSGTPTSVGLGTGGLAKGVFSAMGDMAALSVRIKLGSSPTPGDGPWGFIGSDLPTGFQPVLGPTDMTDFGTSSWLGTGLALNVHTKNLNQYPLGFGLSNFGGTMTFVFALFDRLNTGDGAVLFNFDGTVPFGMPLDEGDMVYGQVVYQRDTSSD